MNVDIYSRWFTPDHANSLFINFSIFKITFSLDELINSDPPQNYSIPPFKNVFQPSFCHSRRGAHHHGTTLFSTCPSQSSSCPPSIKAPPSIKVKQQNFQKYHPAWPLGLACSPSQACQGCSLQEEKWKLGQSPPTPHQVKSSKETYLPFCCTCIETSRGRVEPLQELK